MLSKEERKEILATAHNDKIRSQYREGEKKRLEWIRKNLSNISLDDYFDFLDSAQELFTPFPISRELPTPPYDFRL